MESLTFGSGTTHLEQLGAQVGRALVEVEETERADEFAAALAGIRHLEPLRRVPG